MTKVVVLITAVHVLVHSVFGCCGHAFTDWADADGGHVCRHGKIACAEGHMHQHEHSTMIEGERERGSWSASLAAVEGDTPEPAMPRDDHDCPHDSCSWVVSSDEAAVPSVFQMHWTPFDVAVPSGVAALENLAETINRLDGAETPAPPVRLHLAVGVLLI